MMPRNVLQSLEHLCICSIAFHWDELLVSSVGRKNYKNITLIRHLPEPLLSKIKARLLLSLYRVLTFHDFHLFTSRPLSSLNLKQFSICKSKTVQALQSLVPKMKAVRCLTISNEIVQMGCHSDKSISFANPSNEATVFKCFLHSLSNITHLSFEETQCQDWMLDVIHRHCTQLREINVSHCKDLTDIGIMSLTEDATAITSSTDGNTDPNGQMCLKKPNQTLRHLQKLWLLGTSATQDSVIHLLLHFPYLKLCYHQELLSAFRFLYTANNEILDDCMYLPTSLLKELVCNRECLTLLNEFSFTWNHIWSLKLADLMSNTDLSFLSGLKNLQELHLTHAVNVEKCGLNLSTIGNSCPNLKVLSLNMSGRLKFTHSIPPSAFRSLNSLTIKGMKPDSLSASDAFKLLSRCASLQVLHLCQCPWLSDKILEDIVRLNPLNHIQNLALFKTKLSVDGMIKLLSMKNNLKVLSTSSFLLCTKHRHYFTNYIQKKNWDLIFKLYTI